MRNVVDAYYDGSSLTRVLLVVWCSDVDIAFYLSLARD